MRVSFGLSLPKRFANCWTITGRHPACSFPNIRWTGHSGSRHPDYRRKLSTVNRLLAQIERILEINARKKVTKTVVEAARESLVIGQG